MRSALRLAAVSAVVLAAVAVHAQQPVGELYSSEASVRGAVSFSGGGTRVLSGSQVTAGEAAALLRLMRGGFVRVCPRTTLSLTADNSGKTLVLGMNAGAVEVDYSLAAAADSLLTPDFRLQLISPGDFHFAISVAPTGDTCLRSLEGNTASIFVAEMMGTDSYQLAPGRAVLFKAGRISGATTAPNACGCAAPLLLPAPLAAAPATPAPAPAHVPAEATPEKPLDMSQVKVNTEFNFRGEEHQQDLARNVARLRAPLAGSPLALSLLPQITPPPAPAPPAKPEGFFHRLKNALKRVFAP